MTEQNSNDLPEDETTQLLTVHSSSNDTNFTEIEALIPTEHPEHLIKSKKQNSLRSIDEETPLTEISESIPITEIEQKIDNDNNHKIKLILNKIFNIRSNKLHYKKK